MSAEKTETAQKPDAQENGTSSLDRLRQEVLTYVSHRGRQAVGSMTEKLKNIAEQQGSSGDGNGSLARTAARVAGGENPMKSFVAEKSKDAGKKGVEKVKEMAGGSGGNGKAGDLKAINIIEHIDVGKPLRVVYNHWTQLEDFASFTNGVSDVRRDEEDETKYRWKVRVWPSTRSWEATVLEQVPDRRIVWDSEGSKGTTHGAVSFHYLDEELTRVTVVVEYYPSGFFERVGNIWRAQGRRLRLDLKHFQRYVTLQEQEVEGWRGEIRDGEVVRSHEDVVREEQQNEQQNGEQDRQENGKQGRDADGNGGGNGEDGEEGDGGGKGGDGTE